MAVPALVRQLFVGDTQLAGAGKTQKDGLASFVHVKTPQDSRNLNAGIKNNRIDCFRFQSFLQTMQTATAKRELIGQFLQDAVESLEISGNEKLRLWLSDVI